MNSPARTTLFGMCFCLVLAAFYSCKARAADYSSGNYLVSHCEHYITDNYPVQVWEGQCGGIISAMMFFGSSLSGDARFCPPKGNTNTQAGRVLVNYLHAHPERLHLNLMLLADDAFREAWPCK